MFRKVNVSLIEYIPQKDWLFKKHLKEFTTQIFQFCDNRVVLPIKFTDGQKITLKLMFSLIFCEIGFE